MGYSAVVSWTRSGFQVVSFWQILCRLYSPYSCQFMYFFLHKIRPIEYIGSVHPLAHTKNSRKFVESCFFSFHPIIIPLSVDETRTIFWHRWIQSDAIFLLTWISDSTFRSCGIKRRGSKKICLLPFFSQFYQLLSLDQSLYTKYNIKNFIK